MPDWQNPPYDQDADDSFDQQAAEDALGEELLADMESHRPSIPELQAEVEELRLELLATYDKAEAFGQQAKQSESASNNYREMLRLAQDSSHASHPDWIQRGLLSILGLILAFLVFTAGYGVGRHSVDVYSRDDFPCTEDEVLGYSPAFGPDRVGCMSPELLVP